MAILDVIMQAVIFLSDGLHEDNQGMALYSWYLGWHVAMYRFGLRIPWKQFLSTSINLILD